MNLTCSRNCHGRMVVGSTTTYAIRAYQHYCWIYLKYWPEPSWSWLYGNWMYNFLCNQCLSPLTLWVRISHMQCVLDATRGGSRICGWWGREYARGLGTALDPQRVQGRALLGGQGGPSPPEALRVWGIRHLFERQFWNNHTIFIRPKKLDF
jgi:hypothetical protein